MSWFLIVVTVWVAVAVPLALLVGRSIRHADEMVVVHADLTVPDFVPAGWSTPATDAR